MPEPDFIEPSHRSDPERIGGYAIIGRLGAGAMGEVFLGRSAAGRLVAVKTVKAELADQPDYRERFAREVVAARQVSGAFTAAVIAADPEAARPWLATSYVPAPSLSTVVRECGPLPVPAVCWLGAGCAEALESIHAVGLVHRDLKPSNVLVSLDGPRVIDFGLARVPEPISLTAARSAVGTPAYMAPEQARDNRLVSAASDVYALGANMLFAATGHGPYQGETVMDVLARLASEPPDLGDLPSDLRGVVTCCLSRDPRERPTTAAVLAKLARGIGAGTETGEIGARLLPPPAVALIAEYRRGPQAVADPLASADLDDTVGSQPALPSSSPPRQGDGPGGPGGQAGRWPRRPRSASSGRHRRLVPFAVAAAIAVMALTAGGAAIGTYLAGHHLTQAGKDTAGDSPGLASLSPSAGPGSQQPGLNGPGPVPGQTAPPGPPPGPPPGVPRPELAIIRRFDDHHTVFTVWGSKWLPGVRVTVTLLGAGTAPVHPIVNRAGHFSFVLNAAHGYFHGELSLAGTYQVMVTGPGGAIAFASFTVHRG